MEHIVLYIGKTGVQNLGKGTGVRFYSFSHTAALFQRTFAFADITAVRASAGLHGIRKAGVLVSFSVGNADQVGKRVLSSIFRKFDSEKMKLCAGKPGEGAAKPRLIAAEHMTAAVSGAAKPFILTLDSAGGICYLIAALMPLLLRLRSDISYIDTAWFPTPFPKHTAVWHRPA